MNSLGGIIALLAALIWGTGDYLGGMASHNRREIQALSLSALSGFILLVSAMLIAGEKFPDHTSLFWCVAAGISGALGILALYRGLAISQAAMVAPTGAVVGVILPIIVEAILHGNPPLIKWIGMAIGLVGIWLVSNQRESKIDSDNRGISLGILAGLGFGGFFVMIAQVEQAYLYSPLVVSKGIALLFSIFLLYFRKQSLWLHQTNKFALIAGLFDAGGNILYFLSTKLTRLDVAATLSSMGSAVTVALAIIFSHQQVRAMQKIGIGVCSLAIYLIVS
jgi:drug/metabolite transporter (DMT)-like permease